MALSIGFRVSVSLHLLSKLRGVWLLPRRNSHPLVAPAFLWTRDNLIRPSEHWRRDLQTELLRRLEVDHQFELAWLLDGKVRGLGAFEDLVHIGGGTPIQIGKARSIRHDPPTSTNSRHPYIDGMRNCVASSTIRCRPLVNIASLPTSRAPGSSRWIVRNTVSIPRRSRASSIPSRTPTAWAAASIPRR